ncbi:MAG: fused MFS/spermidine synthase [Armatimonadota bacterium]|nr:fused MFS/spermidine synthase [Armatimonadota bacterium]MDR7587057.1 fused MFS/spermidine synthase [Armatimonadota bacterium]
MLALSVLTSGAVLLALEILASRIVAPTFGNSIYVWGSLIGTFLAALAAGYALGGRVADRWPTTTGFAAVMFAAGALVFPIPLLAPGVLDAVEAADLGPRAGPLVACLVLFGPPGVVMGMASPYAVRLRARDAATLGGVAGALYAVSTAGSIAGSLLASFVVLHLWTVPAIVHGLGGVLLALGVAIWLAARRVVAAGSAALAAAVLLGVPAVRGPAPAPAGLQYLQDTVYHRITVTDEGGIRYLKLDNYWQSGLDLSNPRRTVFPYADYMHLPVLFAPHARRVLMVGLGGGTVPTRYYEDYPGMTIDVVEIDPAVIQVARRYFAVPAGGRLRLLAQDGRLFVARSAERYDIILLDAYLIDTIPFHLATREFFALARARLRPGGVLASNVIGALGGPRSGLFRAVYRTLAEVFPTVYVFPVEWDRFDILEALRNIILVATDRPRLGPADLRDRAARARADPGVTVDGWEEAVGDLYRGPIRVDDVPVLTDDYAPVETLVR